MDQGDRWNPRPGTCPNCWAERFPRPSEDVAVLEVDKTLAEMWDDVLASLMWTGQACAGHRSPPVIVLPAGTDLDSEFTRLYPPERKVTVSPWAGHARAWVRDGNPADYAAMLAADLPTWEEQEDVLGAAKWMPGPPPAEADQWNWMRMERQPQSWWTSPMGPGFRTVLALTWLAGVCLMAWVVAGSWLVPLLVAAVVITWCAAKRWVPWHGDR